MPGNDSGFPGMRKGSEGSLGPRQAMSESDQTLKGGSAGTLRELPEESGGKKEEEEVISSFALCSYAPWFLQFSGSSPAFPSASQF